MAMNGFCELHYHPLTEEGECPICLKEFPSKEIEEEEDFGIPDDLWDQVIDRE